MSAPGSCRDSEGCAVISFVLVILTVVALLAGVNLNGKHYGVSGCSGEGLDIDWGRPVAPRDGGAP